MEKALVDVILAQHAEADAFMATPGNWMGKLPSPEDTEYWSQRVPSGTLAEYNRITLEEDAYYTCAEATSKSYARSHDYSSMTDEQLESMCETYSAWIRADIEAEETRIAEEEQRMDTIASDLGVDRDTLNRWMEQEEANYETA